MPPSKLAEQPLYDGTRYDVSDSLGYQLVSLVLQMRREVDARMVEHSLTNAQWRPLWMIKSGRAKSVHELSCGLGTDAGAMTRMVDRLVSKGLVQRERSDTDRRVVHLVLTAAGEEAVAQVPSVLASVNNDFLKWFTQAEWRQLRQWIARMAANGRALQSDGSV